MFKLAMQAFAGMLFLIVVLGAVIFGCAQTLHYVEGWIFLCEFFICTVLITAYLWKKDKALLQRRVKAGPVAEKQKVQKVIQSIASLSFIGIFAVSAWDHAHRTTGFSVTVECIGAYLIALGFFFVFLVFRKNTFTSATIEVDKQQKIITTGPYAIVRHPMYTGAFILLFGVPLLLGSCYGLLMIIPMILVISWRAVDEEKILRKELAGYEDYMRKVRWRLVPFIW